MEIDSFLPIRPEFEFLRKSSFKKMGDQEGFRIKSIKLRGKLSQGLALPYAMFPDAMTAFHKTRAYDPDEGNFDVTDILGVQKYEAPIPAELSGQVAGNFPSFIKKTDQERCQNLGVEIFETNKDARYEVTVKLDGTSFTGFFNNGEDGVCSRNWSLKVNEENQYNSFVRMFINSGLQSVLHSYGKNIAVSGELMGPGIQGNRENLREHRLYVFDIYNIDEQRYMTPDERHDTMDELWTYGVDGNIVRHVPILHNYVTLPQLNISNTDDLLAFAEGPSLTHSIREGLVYKSFDGKFSFKTISNKFLLKSED